MGLLKDPAGAIGAERRGPVGKPVCLDLPVDIAYRAGETVGGRVVPEGATEALVGLTETVTGGGGAVTVTVDEPDVPEAAWVARIVSAEAGAVAGAV